LVVAGVLLFQRFYQGVVAEVEFEEPVFVAGQPGRVDCCFSALLLDLALVIAAVYFEGGFEFQQRIGDNAKAFGAVLLSSD
jgi:hypothetical protein